MLSFQKPSAQEIESHALDAAVTALLSTTSTASLDWATTTVKNEAASYCLRSAGLAIIKNYIVSTQFQKDKAVLESMIHMNLEYSQNPILLDYSVELEAAAVLTLPILSGEAAPTQFQLGNSYPKLSTGTLTEMRTLLASGKSSAPVTIRIFSDRLLWNVYIDQTGDESLIEEVWKKRPEARGFLLRLLSDCTSRHLIDLGKKHVREIANDPSGSEAGIAISFLEALALRYGDTKEIVYYIEKCPANFFWYLPRLCHALASADNRSASYREDIYGVYKRSLDELAPAVQADKKTIRVPQPIQK
jgi:hypothetical protein